MAISIDGITRELLAVSIFATRMGFDPREEIGIRIDAESMDVGITMHKPGCKNPVMLNCGTAGTRKDAGEILYKWSEFFKAIVEERLGEQEIQKIWEASDFRKSQEAIDALVIRLQEARCIVGRAFKLPGDTEYRCGQCGINPVSGEAISGDTCEKCLEGDQ